LAVWRRAQRHFLVNAEPITQDYGPEAIPS
jgi:hypothetical protein